MASTHIYPTTQTRLAGRLESIVSNLAALQASYNDLKLIIEQIAAGADWTAVKNEFGFADNASAEVMYNLFSAISDDLNSSDVNQLLGRMG